jgi:hypothetical protein
LRGGVVESFVRSGHGSNHDPPILMFGVINRAANNETRENILRSDSRGVITTAKGYCLLDAGFFLFK